jgi:hypothetical protein
VLTGPTGAAFGALLATGDVDLDGTIDLIVASSGSSASLSVFRNPLH